MTLTLTYHVGSSKNPYNNFSRQRYFVEGFRRTLGKRFSLSSEIDTLMANMLDRQLRGARAVWRGIHKITRYPSTAQTGCEASDHVGLYTLKDSSSDQPALNIAIDTSDGGGTYDSAVMQWADVYFKTNYWPGFDYPSHVQPLVNGNGLLNQQKLDSLALLRKQPKTCDLIFWSRLWIPKGEHSDNALEHQVRLFEALARMPVKSKLLAILPQNTHGYETAIARLEQAGVRWEKGWRDIGTKELWDNLASAKVVVLRPGDHQCVSWRMNDLLCMGACIALDGPPGPEWPEPLRAERHYFNGECALDADYTVPALEAYERMTSKLSALIDDEFSLNRYRHHALQYYLNHATPEAVARYAMRAAQLTQPSTAAAAPVSTSLEYSA